MKYLWFLSCFWACLLSAQPSKKQVKYAQRLVSALVSGQYHKLTSRFDEVVSIKLSREGLNNAWLKAVGDLGKFKNIDTLLVYGSDGYEIFTIKCAFRVGVIYVRLTLDENKKIAGIFFLPEIRSEPYRNPPYASLSNVRLYDFVLRSGDFEMNANVLYPVEGNKFPAAVLVHGSGPNDMDESIGGHKMFLDLALGLAAENIVTLRYVKRTRAETAKMAALKVYTPEEEVVEDALNAIDSLGRLPFVDKGKIYLIGHSLGGLLAPRIASRANKLAGIILMAGPARDVTDILKEQIQYVAWADSVLTEEEGQNIAAIEEQIEFLRSDVAASMPDSNVLNAPVGYWLDLIHYDPLSTAKKLSIPMLILQGERDYQVTMEDYGLWRSGLSDKDNAEFISYEFLDHLFSEGKGKSLPSDYLRSGNVPYYVIEDIADWMYR